MFRDKKKNLSSEDLTLEQNQAFLVPRTVNQIQVLAGCAWVTIDGRDIILNSQQSMQLSPSKYRAVISSIGNKALKLQLRSQSADIINAFYYLTQSIQL